MANIVIKKRVSLDFLGKEYEGSYLSFKSISVSEYEKLLGEFENVDNTKSIQLTLKILEEHFLEGKFQNEKVEASDLNQFDVQTLVTCLEHFTGQKIDPKV